MKNKAVLLALAMRVLVPLLALAGGWVAGSEYAEPYKAFCSGGK